MLKKINIACILRKWEYIRSKSLDYSKNKRNVLTYMLALIPI
jgi:hypothetical protein